LEVLTACVEETRALGALLGKSLTPGDFIALCGDLGAGKTQFVQGIARGLAVPEEYRVTSPTYTLLNIYPGRVPLYHFDLYRLTSGAEALDMGFDEYFYGQGACLVEWAERLESECPENYLMVHFQYLSEASRVIRFEPHGERAIKLLQTLPYGEKPFDPLAISC
jgi:tRNA threonylcarbamoyladenosine biosynthesis protein TsaE